MKNFILNWLFIAICAFSITAQSQVTFTGLKKNYTQSMDSLLTYVNKTPISTGILYDRIMPFANLNMLKENGVITNSNYQHFIQSWSELYRSAYNPTFSSLETLKTNINANTNVNIVDIGVINTKMNYINYGSPTTPSLTITNGYIFNISGLNPFLEKQVTVIAPLKEHLTSGTVTFRILSSFMLQLTGLPIKNLVANYGTTTNYNLITNFVVSTTNPTVSFTTSGEKTFTFSATFSNNTTETLTATMYIEVPPVATTSFSATASFPLEEDFVSTAGITPTTAGNFAFQGYNETTATKGALEYRTYYNLVTNNGSEKSKIKKEIIILDGFDPGDGRKIYQGSTGYSQDKSSLYQLMAYDPDNNPLTDNPENLVEKLRSAPYGFDVTLVNFPNGADYIERNVMAVVALLQRENAKLTTNGSTEKIALIGPSMGGLVSRYALAYMEKNNIPHNVKLWVSFDSPHLGANIPIGAQENLYFFGYLGGKDQAKVKFDENFRSPAARQMLIEQLDSKQENAPYPTNLWGYWGAVGQNNNTSFRQQFQTSLNSNGLVGSNGYPQNLRKIALINGTTNGTKTNEEGQMFLELAGFKYAKIKAVIIEDRFLANIGKQSQTFAGKIMIPVKLGQIFGTEIFGIPNVIEGSITRTNINPRGTMDVVQGGTFNTPDIIQSEFTPVLDLAGVSQEWRQNLHKHAFIPTISSLAFKNPNFDWSTAVNRNLVCESNSKEIYFDTYFSPTKNEDHVYISAENANWLIYELQGIPQAPHFPIQAGLLTGPNLICNSNSTYTFLDSCKIPSTATWSVSPNLQIVASTNYSVTVSNIADGQGTITATFQNGQTFTKTIWVGKPSFTFEYTYYDIQPVKSTLCVVSTDPNISLEQQGVTSVTFTGVRNFNAFCIRTTSPFCKEATVTNACGSITMKNDCESFKQSASSATALADHYIIYPNPSNDLVTIDLKEANNQPKKGAVITGELFDLLGRSKSKVELTDNKATFSVKGLDHGIYVLKIYINDQVESHQIAVE